MSGTHLSRAKRALVLLTCLWLLVGPAVANAATGTQQSDPAGTTTVRLQPTSTTVDEGATRTLSVVVADASGGVGAVSGRITVVEDAHAEITEFEFRGDPGLDTVNHSADGDSVTFEGALIDTPQTGGVTVAEVTVRGRQEGQTDVRLSIDTLGNEAGDPYSVDGALGSALTVENTRDEVPLSISASVDSATVGDSVTYTVMRTDSDALVDANVTLGNKTTSTGVDGRATVTISESMVTDAGTITAVASKKPTTQERYGKDSVTITYDDSGPSGETDGSDGGTDTSTETDGSDGETDTGTETDSAGGDGVIVRTEPNRVDLAPGETTTVGVVVTDVDGGIGAGNVTAAVADPDVVEISAAAVTADPGIGGAEVVDDGARATAQFALRDGADGAPVRIVNVTLRGLATGTTTLSLAVDSLGDERGNSYAIGSTLDSGLDVADDAGDATTTGTDGESTDTGDGTANGADNGTTATGDTAPESTTTATTDSGTDTTGDAPPVSADPSTALLAVAVVGVILLGLGALAS